MKLNVRKTRNIYKESWKIINEMKGNFSKTLANKMINNKGEKINCFNKICNTFSGRETCPRFSKVMVLLLKFIQYLIKNNSILVKKKKYISKQILLLFCLLSDIS